MKPIIQKELDALEVRIRALELALAGLKREVAALRASGGSGGSGKGLVPTSQGTGSDIRISWFPGPNGVVAGSPGDIVIDPFGSDIFRNQGGTSWVSFFPGASSGLSGTIDAAIKALSGTTAARDNSLSVSINTVNSSLTTAISTFNTTIVNLSGSVDGHFTDLSGSINSRINGLGAFFAVAGLIDTVLNPTQITFGAAFVDWNPGPLGQITYIRATSDASRNVQGLVSGTDGRIVIITNVNVTGSNAPSFVHEGTAATTNRFRNAGGSNAPGASFGTAIYRYDGTLQRWVNIANS